MEQGVCVYSQTLFLWKKSRRHSMKEHVEKILEKQLQLLSEASVRNRENCEALCELSASMTKVIALLEGERSQFSGEASRCHPCVVQLPIKDLIDLYAARDAYEGLELHARRIPEDSD